MFLRLCLLFVLVPFAELMILVKMSHKFGFLHTIVLVVGTGVLGAALARHEGLRAWTRVQTALGRGKLPGMEVLDAFLILIAGLLLLTPGLLTDLVGFTLLISPSRRQIRLLLANWLGKHISANPFAPPSHQQSSRFRAADDEEIIDVEARPVADPDTQRFQNGDK